MGARWYSCRPPSTPTDHPTVVVWSPDRFAPPLAARTSQPRHPAAMTTQGWSFVLCCVLGDPPWSGPVPLASPIGTTVGGRSAPAGSSPAPPAPGRIPRMRTRALPGDPPPPPLASATAPQRRDADPAVPPHPGAPSSPAHRPAPPPQLSAALRSAAQPPRRRSATATATAWRPAACCVLGLPSRGSPLLPWWGLGRRCLRRQSGRTARRRTADDEAGCGGQRKPPGSARLTEAAAATAASSAAHCSDAGVAGLLL